MKGRELLSRILVYVGEVPLGESGRSASGTEVDVGGAVLFTAQGRDIQGNPVPVNPTWTATKPGIVEIEPVADSATIAKEVIRGLKGVAMETLDRAGGKVGGKGAMEAVGDKVLVKGLQKGTTDIVVEYAGVKATIELISVR